MIKFKEQDGLIFKMLDKPVPLTKDAKMPCLIRLIQDDSPMGRANMLLNRTARFLDMTYTAISVGYYSVESATHELPTCCHAVYEIIGYPVADGSEEWALYQMIQGETVCQKNSRIKRHYDAGYVRCLNRDNLELFLTADEFLKYFDGTMDWQIYKEPEQPKPESENIIHGYIPADMRLKYFHLCKFKVGDWVTDGVVVGHVAVINDGNAWVKTKDAQYHLSVEHLRKLKPSEIVVRIGCLSGTIEKSCDPSYFLMRHSSPKLDCDYSIIRFSAIDTQTHEFVESLLKAQEEE